MFNFSNLSPEYLRHSDNHNKRVQLIVAFVMAFVCFILWADNEVPILPLRFEPILNYYNVSAAFTAIFLLSWLGQLAVRKLKIKTDLMIWFAVLSGFLFIDAIGYLEIGRGSGLTALTLGYMVFAVLLSTRPVILGTLMLGNSLVFYYYAAQIETIDISNYKMSIVFITVLCLLTFLLIENQRIKIFESRKALAAKVSELNKALDVKSVFYGHIVHELRTPLNAIIGFSEMIKTDDYHPTTSEKIKEYSGFIHSSGTHLLKLVNELLDSSKIESGAMDVKIERLDLSETLQGFIDELRPISDDKNQAVRFICDKKDLNLHSDRRLLKQIMFNLISNAQKFTAHYGEIDVIADKNDQTDVIITIKDNGKGIGKDILETINDPASPPETHFISKADGTGFGLIIVRQLVQLLNGTILFKSEPATGTEITLTFPA